MEYGLNREDFVMDTIFFDLDELFNIPLETFNLEGLSWK